MWAHPATVANCALLAERGVIFIGPEEGSQACGEFGLGRMSETDNILAALRLYEVHQLLQGRNVLITAGPTREAIDPVRYISNHSSGKMGYALAQAAAMAGAKVTLISGPTTLNSPFGVDVHRVDSAEEMQVAVMNHLQPGMIFIGTAAVADYHVQTPAKQKLKKADNSTLTLTLEPNPDILAAVAKSGKASFVVGFAAETNDVLANAEKKLQTKKVDMIVANKVGDGLGFENDCNQVTIVTNKGRTELALAHKTRLAGQIIAILATSLQNVAQ
jgi:phosphopantothenoylcysteine decarboxylase/phosphopantothenate--cysteine ligase